MNRQGLNLRSAIPSSTNSLPRRPPIPNEVPDQAITVYANHFECKIEDNVSLYQYNITIERFDTAAAQANPITDVVQRNKVMRDLFRDDRLTSGEYIWYDVHENHLYSRSIIPVPMHINSDDFQIHVLITEMVQTFSTNDIHRYINGDLNNYPSKVVRILETLLKQSLGPRIRVINQRYYFLSVQARDAQGGLEQREGFVGALHLHSQLITWNVQRKDTYFYADVSLREFIRKEIGEDRIPFEHELERIVRILNGCKIVIGRNDPHVYTFVRFDGRRPSEIFIDDNLTLENHYTRSLGFTLAYPDYPCVEAFSDVPGHNQNASVYIPCEFCHIQEWQIYTKHIQSGPDLEQNILEPIQRYSRIMDLANQCDFNRSPLCQNVGFTIDTNEIIRVPGHVLRRPRIAVSHNDEADVSIGSIHLRGRLFKPAPIKNLRITYFGSNFDNRRKEIKTFEQQLVSTMERKRIYRDHTFTVLDQTDRQSIDQYLRTLPDEGRTIVVCIVERNADNRSDELVANIRDLAATERGIMTQCVELNTITSTEDLATYCENVVAQLNNKNDGLNSYVELDEAIKDFSYGPDSFMFFGADTINTKTATRRCPSYTAVVASRDPMCSRSVNRISRQYPRENACAIETILSMRDMVVDLMRFYRDRTKSIPNKVVFYRHGILKNDFGKIFEHEIPLIYEAFNQIYGEKKDHPKLTYIVVQRHHHTRFFNYDRERDETRNIEMGTVIDRKLVHPYHHDFYLNSHVAIGGVNKTSLYHVLLNEIELTDEELHLLTYHLAFTDPRSTAAEAMPSVVHQAQKTTRKAHRHYQTLANAPMSPEIPIIPFENPTLDDIISEVLDVHRNVENQLIMF